LTRDCFKRANFGKEGPKDRLEMVSREPTWAKKVPTSAKVPRIDQRGFQGIQLGQRRSQG